MSQINRGQPKIHAEGFGGRVANIIPSDNHPNINHSGSVLRRSLLALLVAGVLTLAACGIGNQIPADATINDAIAAVEMSGIDRRVIDFINNPNCKWSDTRYDTSSPEYTFAEMESMYLEAYEILTNIPTDETALKTANTMIYGMAKTILKANVCTAFGIQPEQVVSFWYDGNVWGNDPNHPRTAVLTYKTSYGEDKKIKVEISGDLANLAINGDRAANLGFKLTETNDSQGFNNRLHDAYLSLVRALSSELEVEKPGLFGGMWELVTTPNEDVIKLISVGNGYVK